VDVSTLALFCAAAVALAVVPGPAVLYIVARSVEQGRAAGLVSVLGIHLGTTVGGGLETIKELGLGATDVTPLPVVEGGPH
jgi:threonine/homoserine/homoserine lactone efflux protein